MTLYGLRKPSQVKLGSSRKLYFREKLFPKKVVNFEGLDGVLTFKGKCKSISKV